MKDGSTISEEINVADAHPAGKKPFGRKEYIQKFKTLTNGIISKGESERFLRLVQNLNNLKNKDLIKLNPQIKKNLIKKSPKISFLKIAFLLGSVDGFFDVSATTRHHGC